MHAQKLSASRNDLPVLMEPVEERVLLSAAPVESSILAQHASPAPLAAVATPASVLTLADRQQLIRNWRGPIWRTLSGLLAQGKTRDFDRQLLAYMKQRTVGQFLYSPADVPKYIEFMSRWDSAVDTTLTRANNLLAHRFPPQLGSPTYNVQLPSQINWLVAPAGTNASAFIHGLNRHSFWKDLSQAYRLTNDPRYINELIAQLSSWSQQHTPLRNPDDWRDTEPRWWQLDASVRPRAWVEVYTQVIGTAGWTAEANTLFLHRMWQHGDFLRRVTPRDLDDNWTLQHAHGLSLIAEMFPEFLQSADWQGYSRKLLFAAFNTQFYPDGGHAEQSVTYASTTLLDMLIQYQLDRRNGVPWLSSQLRRLRFAIEAFYQLVQPDGTKPALSDTYRTQSVSFFTAASVILNNPRWPITRSSMANLWLLGPDVLEKYLAAPTAPDLTNRGSAYPMRYSGYYIMRSGDDRQARQLIFDAGPTGGNHGHFDLLNFELYGYGKPLIADPGLLRYDFSADRAWVQGTPAHNTISVDRKNHAALEGLGNRNIRLDQWEETADHVQVTAHHFGYSALAGSPALARSIWYDKNNTMLIVDWAQSSADHTYTISYTLPTTKVSAISGRSIRTTTGQGDVQISVLPSGRISVATEQRFTSSAAPPNEKDPAIRFAAWQKTKSAIFATLITTYEGNTPPNVTAEFIEPPRPGLPVRIRLTQDGVSREVVFQPPVLTPLTQSRIASSGIAAPRTPFATAAKIVAPIAQDLLIEKQSVL